jgi:superfamily II DNA or RNA helicase
MSFASKDVPSNWLRVSMLIDRSEVGRAFQKGRVTIGKRKLRRGVSFSECVCMLRTSTIAARGAGMKHGHSKRDFSDGSSAAGVNTLVLVHRTELLKQWQERLQAFLGVGKGMVGTIGGGKARPTGKIDIAVMQSLSRRGETSELVENYGHVIVDECHHLSAVSFEALLKRVKARYVLGLTATPMRRDGQHAIIFMQCGPIRFTAARPDTAPHDLAVVSRRRSARIELSDDAGIQDVFRHIAGDADRTGAIAKQVEVAFSNGRKILVLTERTAHLEAIAHALAGKVEKFFTLHGRMSKKQRALAIDALNALQTDSARVLLATGKLVGEGFDHPALDTLILAMPISWKGTLQQYAGRLHREHATKTDVRITDIVDVGHPALQRMWEKRQRGYRAMGYRITDGA